MERAMRLSEEVVRFLTVKQEVADEVEEVEEVVAAAAA
jgi:ribosomal protein S6